jgi:outer membrane protein TolC
MKAYLNNILAIGLLHLFCANRRYEGGLSNSIEVLVAEDDWLTRRRAPTDMQARSFALDVALARALGGGFRQ